MIDPEVTEFQVDLDCAPDAAGIARRFVHEHSDRLPTDLIEDAELLVSELVTNAVQHGRPAITLVVSLRPPLIGVSVRDEGANLPPAVPVGAATTASSGRGMCIVDRVSSSWGIVPADPPPGKTVWFRLDALDADYRGRR